MDNRSKVKKLNKKLLVMFVMMLTIFVTLLVVKDNVLAVPAEMESKLQMERDNPTYLTYEDLVGYYDILCCQHGTTLNGKGRVMLTGSNANGGFSYDMGKTTLGVGDTIDRHTHTSGPGSDYDKETYKHRTYGFYSATSYIGRPSESYIIAEMKNELGTENGGPSAAIIHDDGVARKFTGSLTNAIEVASGSGENIYIVNQTYVLETDDGSYYVNAAKDSDGNLYYVYATNADGSLKRYTGDFKYEDPMTGEKNKCLGVSEENVYYEHGGSLESGDVVASKKGTLYLVDYDTVVKKDDEYYECEVWQSGSYIQQAWWTTYMGTSGWSVPKGAPNGLSKEAEAFENYILEITGIKPVEELMKHYKEQEYDFYDGEEHYHGSVQAPIIDYNPGFNEDANLDETINAADEVTISFDYNENKYVIGPFSLHYTKSRVSVPGRNPVDFSVITEAHLVGNTGELAYGEDWEFKYLFGYSRDLEEDYIFPNPNEVFYITINYQGNEWLNEIVEFKFKFKYMNAGSQLDIYSGKYRELTWTAMNDDNYEENEDGEDEYVDSESWLQCTNEYIGDSQRLAHALKGARWYNYKECSKGITHFKSGKIKIKKTTYSSDDREDKVQVDKKYHFKIYINGEEYQELTLKTENGYGEVMSGLITWREDDPDPSYKVVEIGDIENNGPWEGTVKASNTYEHPGYDADSTLTIVEASNYLKPEEGKLKIDKKLTGNNTEALKSETFKFEVTVTGKFSYNGTSGKYNSKNPLKIGNKVDDEGNPYVEIIGDGEWTSEKFEWYEDAPKYEVKEIIPDGAKYELANGVINNGDGYLKPNTEDGDPETIATATNSSITDETTIEVDKRMLSETKPKSGEEFQFNLKITGQKDEAGNIITTFDYGDEKNLTEKTFDNLLLKGDDWTWRSEKIVWNKDEVPDYTISEVLVKGDGSDALPDGTKFYSISDEKLTSKVNDFHSQLNPELTKVIITNSREDRLIGKLKINKLVEGEISLPQTFHFKVTINGNFEYCKADTNGLKRIEQVTGEKVFDDIQITVNPNTSGELPSSQDVVLSEIVDAVPATRSGDQGVQGSVELGYFRWNEEDDAPTYTVEEIEDSMPAGFKFVSISDGEKIYTSSRSISGTLNGVIEKDAFRKDESGNSVIKAGQVLVTCINSTTGKPKQAHIAIIKESTDEKIDGLIFYFKVTITGTFKYWDKVTPEGDLDYTQYTNQTLVLDGTINDVEAVCGAEDWISELITWEENDSAPTYTVEEISIPANVKFVSISNREKTSSSPKIEGTLVEGAEKNYITAINEPGPDFKDGSIRIVKKVTEDLKGKKFYFKLEVEATNENGFDYAGKHYNKGEKFVLDKIEVEGNGNPWISGLFTWNEGDEAPKYTVTEYLANALDDNGNPLYDVEFDFVSISNEKEISTDEGNPSISGSLDNKKPVKITAINYGDDKDKKSSHIEITKEVLNEKLKGRTFYFDVEITGQDAFRYHDLEDPSKVTEYKDHSTLLLENVPVIADEKDWISGLVEWGYDDSSINAPTYKITEVRENFYDGNGERNDINSVSIRNDTEIKLFGTDYDLNGDSLPIVEGTVNGGVTHIIAVNDQDEDTPVSGKIVIEKKALSEIIDGEEFKFSLVIEGKFQYGGKDYRKLELNDIKITANGDSWVSEEIKWYEKDGAPTYTVKEDTATFADGEKFVSIRNAHQTNTEPMISGTVEPNFENWVLAENTFIEEKYKGRIQIHKILLDEKGNEIDGIDFRFNVKIKYKDGRGEESTTVTVTSGKYWRSDWYTWSKKDEIPDYEVSEIIEEGYTLKDIKNQTGQLKAQDVENGESGIVFVEATNIFEGQHKGQIKINKKLILNDKVTEDDVNVSFTALVNITGKFRYKGKAYNDETMTLRVLLEKGSGWTWTSDEISWNGDEAPIFTVEEPSSNIPSGWTLVKTESSVEDNKLVDGGIVEVDITNEWNYDERWVLITKLGGRVWDDTNRTSDKEIDSLENGKIDEGEPGISNVKVRIYRKVINKSTGKEAGMKLSGVYIDNGSRFEKVDEVVTYTDDIGNWSFDSVAVPAFSKEEYEGLSESEKSLYVVTYDVEFEYDGQTYEPTKFLASAGEESKKTYVGANSSNNMYSEIGDKWKKYQSSSTSEKDNYLLDSMAIDNKEDREGFNSKFEEIKGKSPMDGDGNTVGQTGTGEELNYTSVDSVSFFNSDNSRKISSLRTANEEDEIYDNLKITNRTSNANLTFPFYTDDLRYDKKVWHLMSWDKEFTDVFRITYKCEAIYNYCLSINLGLVEREAADVAVEKDLTEALVVVNGKALKYKFNSAIDLENPDKDNKELLYKQLAVEDAQIEYKLGLYKGDYYYRADVYNSDAEVKGALEGYYVGTLGLPSVQSSELEIYLKYTIKVHNESEGYDVDINELADYYDETFTLVDDNYDYYQYRYIQTLNGEEVNQKVQVAEKSKVTFEDGSEQQLSWENKGNKTGSNEVEYTKITTSGLKDRKLKAGEVATITATFVIDKDTIKDVDRSLKLGKKHNVVEITSFSSYYSNNSVNRWSEPKDVAGRVDEDSAPDNVNIEEYNDKAYYEDDTDSAPILTVEINGNSENRKIDGIVWDDAQTKDAGYGQVVGDGLYNPDQDDKLINNLTTEIYESITIPVEGETNEDGKPIYKEYLFKWPTDDTSIAAFKGQSMAQLTGFNQKTVTKNGEYSFINMPAGNYKVRYVYGDKEISTGNKDSMVVYNGQDYKTTAYQTGFDNDGNDDGYIDNEWHNISDSKLADLRVNDARDDEARRLYISAQSEMLTNVNSTLLSSADKVCETAEGDTDIIHKDLFGEYNPDEPRVGNGFYMYAETAKINLSVEDVRKVKEEDAIELDDGTEYKFGTIYGDATQNGRDVGNDDFTYHIKNIDCGIEERSQTKITLDKQIKEIVLTTSDLNVILDAVYDISYTLKSDGTIASSVTLNKEKSTSPEHIASLNRKGAYEQGYRYVIADSQILQGAQIKVQYQLTIFNMSETDRISKELEELWAKFDATNAYNKVNNNLGAVLAGNADFNAALDKLITPLYIDGIGRVIKNSDGKYISVGYGTYFGSVYYLGSQGVGVRPDEVIVKTKVHQLMDYVDPDVEFSSMDNTARDQSWTNTEINYLNENDLLDKQIIKVLNDNGEIVKDEDGNDLTGENTLGAGQRYSIISDKLQEYSTESKNNLIMAISDGTEKENGTNPGFIKFLEPYMANNNVERATGSIALNVSRTYSSELDTSDIDNIAEIIKVENTAGRRDARNISGNANPYQLDENGEPIGVYTVATQGKEKDASATEVITLSPPTGLSPEESRTIQLIVVILVSVTLVAVSIVVIKKKVLTKN